jgi:hypothetical protein
VAAKFRALLSYFHKKSKGDSTDGFFSDVMVAVADDSWWWWWIEFCIEKLRMRGMQLIKYTP